MTFIKMIHANPASTGIFRLAFFPAAEDFLLLVEVFLTRNFPFAPSFTDIPHLSLYMLKLHTVFSRIIAVPRLIAPWNNRPPLTETFKIIASLE